MVKHTELYNIKSKKSGMSIAYAIILLIIVGVAIMGLTPVLTRKLPNLATSSTIKHPKGWYESYNAPDKGVKYCKKNCKDKDNEGKPWDTPSYEKIVQTTNDECYGNPSCLPYIDPTTPPDKIIAFERYCKSNGKCTQPAKCNDGKCRFTPPEGVTKFEVYAIGGGGGSGSAVARNRDKEFLWSKMSGYKKNVGGRNNHSGTDKYDEYTPAILPRGSDAGYNVLPDPDSIVGAHFIDLNRKDTASAGYAPEDFVYENGHERDEQHPYSNRLKGDIINKCATGILYTVGDSSRNFHIYPTEDADSRLSKNVSDKQIKRILKEHGESPDKKYGSFNFYYYNRYYLFTHQLGVYSYNQNPVYSLMPEWIILKPDDKKYPVDTDFHKYVDGTNTSTYCENKDCNINYYSSGECGSIKNGGITPITSKYKTVAAVACSGDGGEGGNATVTLKSGSDACAWMSTQACEYDTLVHPGSANADYKQITFLGSCPNTTRTAPAGNTYQGDVPSHSYCFSKKADFNGQTNVHTTCHYNAVYVNRECKFKETYSAYAKCTCNNKPLPNRCKNNDDVKSKCGMTSINTGLDPNAPKDRALVHESVTEDLIEGMSSDYVVSDENGNESIYRQGVDGTIYKVIDEAGHTMKIGTVGKPLEIDANGNPKYSDAQMSKADQIMIGDLGDTLDVSSDEITAEKLEYKGGGTVNKCTTTRDYTRRAYGGKKGKGVCTYKLATIRKGKINQVYTNPDIGYQDGKPKAATATACDGKNNGEVGDSASACIKFYKTNGSIASNCATANGGKGGTGGKISCPLCTGAGKNGKRGADGTVSNGGKFAKKDRGNSALKYTGSAYLATSSDDKYQSPNVTDGADITGTQKQPGVYNFRYIWYMPFVTKHLLFGTAGDTGEELHTTITLSQGQTLDVTPGKGAAMTNYKSGGNGAKGGDSTIVNKDARVNLAARGGKGGIGSQKTDEYVLCHISDLQGTSPELPCYAKRMKNGKLVTNYKKTHYYDSNKRQYVGIQAILPKAATIGKSLKMSESLKQSNPGAGAMGFGTESVSDFICEERHVDKLDQVNGGYSRKNVIRSSGINQDNTINEKCNGNSRIRYILPNAKDYSSSTGAVIIVW